MTLSDFTLLSICGCYQYIFWFFFYCTNNGGQLFEFLHVLSGSPCLCAGGFVLLLTLLLHILHLHGCVKSNQSVLVGKCYKSSQQFFILHHTPGRQYCSFYVYHCNSNILFYPLCLFACSFFIPNFSQFILRLKFGLFVFDSFDFFKCYTEGFSLALSASFQYRYILIILDNPDVDLCGMDQAPVLQQTLYMVHCLWI